MTSASILLSTHKDALLVIILFRDGIRGKSRNIKYAHVGTIRILSNTYHFFNHGCPYQSISQKIKFEEEHHMLCICYNIWLAGDYTFSLGIIVLYGGIVFHAIYGKFEAIGRIILRLHMCVSLIS